MQDFLDQVAGASSTWILALSALSLVLTVMVLRQGARLRRMETSRSTLLRRVTGENLEEMMDRHLREQVRLEGRLESLEERTGIVEKQLARSKRHMGVVRYDAFPDVGGHQSFVLAVLDDHGEGAILNGLVGRNDIRVFCKPLNGDVRTTLSHEEEQAIAQATRRR